MMRSSPGCYVVVPLVVFHLSAVVLYVAMGPLPSADPLWLIAGTDLHL